MKERKKGDLPEADLNLTGCAELSPVVAEVQCLEEHFQLTDEAMYDSFLWEPTDQELMDAFPEEREIDDPFYGMTPPEFDRDGEVF